MNTIERAVIPLCATLLLMEMGDEALDLFFEFYARFTDSNNASLFGELLPYVADMLLKLATHPESEKEKIRLSVINGAWAEKLKFFNDDFTPIATRKCNAVNLSEAAGLGIDYVKAMVCFWNAKRALQTSADRENLEDAHEDLISAMQMSLASLYFLEQTIDRSVPASTLNKLSSLWLKADVLAMLSHLCDQLGKPSTEEEAYALLALDSIIEAFGVSKYTHSPLLAVLTGRHGDILLTKLQTVQASTSRLVKLGKVAELSTNSILSFPSEKMKPLVDFSRSVPIRSMVKDEVSIDIRVTPSSSSTVTYWSRPWFQKPPPRRLDF